MKYILRISIVFILGLTSCIIEHDNEPPCGDNNGMVNDRCASVNSKVSGYKSDGSTFEEIVLVFHPDSSSAVDLFISDSDSLIEEGTYSASESSLSFSGKSSGGSFVTITKVERTESGRKISGIFSFVGKGEANFQSYDVTKNGEFNNVTF